LLLKNHLQIIEIRFRKSSEIIFCGSDLSHARLFGIILNIGFIFFFDVVVIDFLNVLVKGVVLLR
jgi:hypothetical protein